MNAPMVVVQGDLLLPTLFPLAGMPNAVYGEEWTLTGTRPALTEYEIPFYAARFLTAYISALSLRNDRFPYTPASLWGKFKRNDEVNHAEKGVGVPEVHVDAEPQVAEPAPFAFEPFTAPDDRYVKTPAASATANHDHRKQLAGGAIALACAAFIAWALFGTKIGHQDAETQKPKVMLSAIPAIKPTSDSEPVHASGASSATVVVASASPSTGASTAAVVTTSPSASASTAAKTAASVADSAARSTTAAIPALPAVQKPVDFSSANGNSRPPVSTAASMSIKAGDGRTTAPNTVSERATKARSVAQALERHGAKAKAKSKRDAHRYEVMHRRHGHGYQGEPVYRSTGHEAPLTSPGRRTLTRDDTRSNTASSSLSVTDMYNMLAHSAVLDDNSGASRQPARATPRAAAGSPSARSSASDAPSWNSDLSQRRVTDAPSQFSK
ncbi:hypothetical protein [Caballeronia sordidicola]|nr:hypothetical protein [Caballeronia sordidicola]